MNRKYSHVIVVGIDGAGHNIISFRYISHITCAVQRISKLYSNQTLEVTKVNS